MKTFSVLRSATHILVKHSRNKSVFCLQSWVRDWYCSFIGIENFRFCRLRRAVSERNRRRNNIILLLHSGAAYDAFISKPLTEKSSNYNKQQRLRTINALRRRWATNVPSYRFRSLCSYQIIYNARWLTTSDVPKQ